ncbi:Acyl- dehydrogenase family member 9, mitochondrial [Paramuricea clavata]|uniref:Acyl- dehydrogenase family member 9, mitochondrial n=1 Tax=Paramuricea clavata TaxID=317549 RepID=A0A6S7ISA3_PARCT|nr:Acyl- dehydrogenase family member 9, mitochondrial [Paramuricea clavata]
MSVYTKFPRVFARFYRFKNCSFGKFLNGQNGQGVQARQEFHASHLSAVFAKELFVGNFVKDKVFPYPEPTDDQQETLQMMIDPVERFFTEKVDSAQIDREATIPKDVLDGLKELGLFGLQIPEEYCK